MSPMCRARPGQIPGLHRLDRAERRRARHRVAAVRAAEPAHVHGVHQLGPPGDTGQRQPVRDPLGRRDQIRDEALVLAREPVAGPAETGLDLVRDQDDLVAAAPFGQPGQEPGRRHDEPALALDRLDDDRGHVLLADLGVDQPGHDVQGLGAACLGAAGPAQRVGHRRPVDLPGERPEALLVRHVLGGQRHGQVGAPVIGVVERDDRLAPGRVPGDLDRVLHRLRARVEQRGPLLVIARRARRELLADRDVLLVRGDHEAGVGEPGDLLADPLHHARRGVARRHHGDARAEVDERVAVRVDQHAAAGGGDEHRQHVAHAARDAALPAAEQLA